MEGSAREAQPTDEAVSFHVPPTPRVGRRGNQPWRVITTPVSA